MSEKGRSFESRLSGALQEGAEADRRLLRFAGAHARFLLKLAALPGHTLGHVAARGPDGAAHAAVAKFGLSLPDYATAEAIDLMARSSDEADGMVQELLSGRLATYLLVSAAVDRLADIPGRSHRDAWAMRLVRPGRELGVLLPYVIRDGVARMDAPPLLFRASGLSVPVEEAVGLLVAGAQADPPAR